MTKEEFLSGLRTALNSTGSYQLIEENLQFYSDYIAAETAKGRTEAEVMEELGDPRLIANSIRQAGGYASEFQGSGDPAQNQTWSQNSGNSGPGNQGYRQNDGQGYYQNTGDGQGYYRNNGQDGRGGNEPDRGFFGKFSGLKPVLILFAVLFVLFLILTLVFRAIGSMLAFAFRYADIILVVLLVLWIFRRRNRY